MSEQNQPSEEEQPQPQEGDLSANFVAFFLNPERGFEAVFNVKKNSRLVLPGAMEKRIAVPLDEKEAQQIIYLIRIVLGRSMQALANAYYNEEMPPDGNGRLFLSK